MKRAQLKDAAERSGRAVEKLTQALALIEKKLGDPKLYEGAPEEAAGCGRCLLA